MSDRRLAGTALLCGLGLVLAACGSNDAEVRVYAKQKKMSEVQTAAFAACARDTRRKKLLFPVKDGNLVLKRVPLDVCACQSKTMVSVFRDGKYDGHTAFLDHMAKERRKRPPRLARKDLVAGLKPVDAGRRLEDSLIRCVNEFRTANADKEAELFEVVPLPPGPEKKRKDHGTEKTASAF